ncbi:hypothetical protein NQ317_012794 [Molorchus minor]|uniref:Uncharacterized protein n=1 Tax=Molorchus minor TaxID=1323400 RepID=A0ABQ9K3F3_9CUCU|nr:hypothetical protein NQ317_012794 [Molorchus minor]
MAHRHQLLQKRTSITTMVLNFKIKGPLQVSSEENSFF